MDAVTLKALLLDSIKKNIGVNFTFSREGELFLEEAASEADDKRRAALIINALNVTDNGQVEEKYDPEYYIDDLVEDLYDEDDPDESALSNPELNKIEAHQVIDVEFENHLPISITFTKLEYPITSVAFMGVIQKVLFGDPKESIYRSEYYQNEHECLDKLGIHIPESVFQYHYFVNHVLTYCGIFEYLLTSNDLIDEGRFFPLIDRQNCLNGGDEGQIKNDSNEYKDLLEYIFRYGWGVVSGKNIVLFTADRAQGGLFYNEGEDRYMGFYWGEGGATIYRSLPDYVNSTLSTEIELFLLLAAFRAFVELNDVTINDGIDYLRDSDTLEKSVSDFVCEGVKFNPAEDVSYYTIGWFNEVFSWDA